MSITLASAWRRHALALHSMARADYGPPGLSPSECIEWLDDAFRLARERGTLREEDPADPIVLRRRRRIGRAVTKLRA